MGRGIRVFEKIWQGHRDRTGPHAGWGVGGVMTSAKFNRAEWDLWVDASVSSI